MKHLIVLILLIQFFIGNAQCDQSVTLLTQADVNNFPANFDCEYLTGTLSIGIHNAETDITNLDSLFTINRVVSLDIINNPLLTDISGLSNITQVNISISITNNNRLKNLTGLKNISQLSNLGLSENDSLVDLSALSNLTSINGNLSITHNRNLTHIDSLRNLTSIGQTLSITGNRNLRNIDGLKQVQSIGWSIFIQQNGLLENIDGLSGLTQLNWGINLGDNGIKNLDGLLNVTSVGMTLFILRNDSLNNLTGLRNITHIGEDLYIGNNDQLESLDGLENIRKLEDGGFQLEYNDRLEDIDALSNLMEVDQGIEIQENPHLADCCPIYEMLSDHTAFQNIRANQTGCSSFMEIMDNCFSSIDHLKPMNGIIYPNPSQGIFTFIPDISAPYSLNCTDLFGKSIFTHELLNDNISFTLDLPGIYIVTYSDGKRRSSFKIHRN